jgi:4-diphosphocytidyl-2-C-methyl-D-erythritol kinase
MDYIKIDCAAKINIGLDVLSRRADGYHEIRTLIQSVSLFDTLECEKTDGISITCSDAQILTDETNIVWKCIRAVKDAFGIGGGMRVHLTKRIPYCAGLGGGSADGAAAVTAMAALYGINTDLKTLSRITKNIGADIPYMFYGGLCICQGMGDAITPLGIDADCAVLVVKPDVCISTKEAYDAIDAYGNSLKSDFASAVDFIAKARWRDLRQTAANVFERYAADAHPKVGGVKEALYALGADFAMMSGSGSAVYGLFKDVEKARSAQAQFDTHLGTVMRAAFTDKALYSVN